MYLCRECHDQLELLIGQAERRRTDIKKHSMCGRRDIGRDEYAEIARVYVE